MEGQQVVTSDDQKLGTVIASRDDCAIVETGTVFKSKHAGHLDQKRGQRLTEGRPG